MRVYELQHTIPLHLIYDEVETMAHDLIDVINSALTESNVKSMPTRHQKYIEAEIGDYLRAKIEEMSR